MRVTPYVVSAKAEICLKSRQTKDFACVLGEGRGPA